MKKNILCVFVALLALLAQARPVSPEEAKLAASAWAARNAAYGDRRVASGEAVPFANEVTTLWYQVQMTDGSCLIVSPVTELEPVIAALENVSATAGLPEGHPMRAMLVSDMTDRLRKLGLYESHGTSGGTTLMGAVPPSDETPEDPALAAWAERGKAKWGRFLSSGGPQLMAAPEEGITDIEVQVGIVDGFESGGRFTHWNQGNGGGGYCYNYYTPRHAVCGCVATMMSAIMQYFAVTGGPSGVTGVRAATYNGSSVDANGNPFRTLGGTYDWSKFAEKTDRRGYNSLTDEQREILGRVAYDAGVAIGMGWTDGESGAITLNVAEAFRTVFGFVDARGVRSPTENQYAKLIYNQCRAGAPVGLSIRGEGGGHAVVGVGYGEDDDGVPRVRIFTGWGGGGDGWYALPYVTTASVPGGGNFMFDVLGGVITMIGYDSDETVPVVGGVGAQGEGIEVPGAATNTTVLLNEYGYFGTRVSPSTIDCRVIYRGKEMDYEIGEDAAVKEGKFIVDGDKLCAALPEEITLSPLKSSVAYTFAKAKAMALAEGKAILRVSGVIGSEATTNLLSYIYALDDANEGDFTNKFVYFFTSAKSSNPDLPDGDPSIGVFLPTDAEQGGRWQYTNGRLAYGYGYSTELEQTVTNDYEVAEGEEFYTITNEAFVATWGQLGTELFVVTNLPYTIPGGLTEMAQLVLDGGWTEYCRRTHGITLTVTTAGAAEAGTPEPTYGTHENTFTNGQVIAALAPTGQVTNDERTVISEFRAWTLTVTNTVAGGPETVTTGTGTTASFSLASNDVATLVWKLEPKYMWIDIHDEDDGLEICRTSPGSGWYPYGGTVMFTAIPGDGCAFSQWTSGTSDDLPYYLDSFRGQPALSFRVEEPLSLIAYYTESTPAAETVSGSAQPLTVLSLTDDGEYFLLLDDANLPMATITVFPAASGQQVAMGSTNDLPAETSASVALAANSFTDSTGGVWTCVGWMLAEDSSGKTLAEGNGTITSRFALKVPATLGWLWEPVGDGPVGPQPRPPAAVPVGPGGATSSPITIAQNANGTLKLSVTVGNAAKDYWYAIVTATEVAGPYAVLTDTNGGVYKKADADGTLDLGEIPINPNEARRFFKVRVYEEESDIK